MVWGNGATFDIVFPGSGAIIEMSSVSSGPTPGIDGVTGRDLRGVPGEGDVTERVPRAPSGAIIEMSSVASGPTSTPKGEIDALAGGELAGDGEGWARVAPRAPSGMIIEMSSVSSGRMAPKEKTGFTGSATAGRGMSRADAFVVDVGAIVPGSTIAGSTEVASAWVSPKGSRGLRGS